MKKRMMSWMMLTLMMMIITYILEISSLRERGVKEEELVKIQFIAEEEDYHNQA
jgi:hypothetical protein